ncbi:DegT/DnrJ/EryC1/StrS family aminotransferase [Microlunatus sp. Y2014]|uniref:DegT/DnrJ/EryC1/StrS family aminotransferase n=1 Tax=Microlunatus sp. Y2014 TaxID=3418488 RepID=UPI003DA6FC41
MSERIHLSSPDVTEAEIVAVTAALRSGWIAPLGPDVDAFEAELAIGQERSHCVALSSGTAALHLALLGLGVQPGDIVITATMTFAATANAISYTGAEPLFVDCSDDGNINPDLVRQAFVEQTAAGRRVGAVVPVDLLGKVAEHAKITEIADEFGAPVLSDAAESLGAMRDGRPSGSFGHAAAISFNGNKIMTTSGGGALLTDDADLAAQVRYLATQARQPVVHYEHTDIGYNYRLSNILAALGRAQLARLESMIEVRRRWRRRYGEFFADTPGVTMFGGADVSDDHRDNCWLSAILIDPAVAPWDRDLVMHHLAAAGIESRPLWKPMHAQPVFANRRRLVDGTSDRLFEIGLSLPSGSSLTEAQFDRVLEVLDTLPAEVAA